jgi:flagellar M-ring protein FliF
VSVDATLNFEEIRRTDQNIVPMKGPGTEVGAVVRRRESLQRQAPPQTATTAMKAVDTIQDPPAPNSGPVTSTTEVEYEYSKSAEQVLSTPGSIRRVSVGVIVPENLTEDQLARVRDVIAMSVGFNAERGDALTVQSLSRIVSQLKETGGAENDPVVGSTPPSVSTPQHRVTGVTWLRGTTEQWLTFAAVVLIAVLVVVFLPRRRVLPADLQRLSAPERRQLLEDMRSWIDSEKAHPSGGTRK